MHTLVTRDEFVGESETGHKTALLNPEDGTERSREENSLNSGESDETLSKAVGGIDPLESPVSLLGDGGDVVDGLEEEIFFFVVLDEGVDKNRVGLGVNVFHHHLEAVEATGFRHLDLGAEPLSEVFKHNAITGSEKGENVFDEVLLVTSEFLPIFGVLAKIDLVNGPEASHLIFVHLPDVLVLDGQDHEAIGVILKKRLGHWLLGQVLTLGRVSDRLVGDNLGISTAISFIMGVK